MRLFWRISAILGLLASAVSIYLFYETYWKFRTLFDENGRYFDALESVVHNENSFYWLIVSALFATLALVCRLKMHH